MRNLSLLTDLYELSMANGFHHDLPQTNATFDLFYRRVPDNGSFVIAAGLQQVVEALQDFHLPTVTSTTSVNLTYGMNPS